MMEHEILSTLREMSTADLIIHTRLALDFAEKNHTLSFFMVWDEVLTAQRTPEVTKEVNRLQDQILHPPKYDKQVLPKLPGEE